MVITDCVPAGSPLWGRTFDLPLKDEIKWGETSRFQAFFSTLPPRVDLVFVNIPAAEQQKTPETT